MRIRSACSVNKKLFLVVLVTLLPGTLFLTMSAFGEDDGKCIEGNCYDGQGTYTWSDGSKYVGSWKNDKEHGEGTFTRSDGRKYVGSWKDGKFDGQGTYTWPDGSKYVGMFKDGKFDGQGTLTLPDGSKYVGSWKDGKRHEE